MTIARADCTTPSIGNGFCDGAVCVEKFDLGVSCNVSYECASAECVTVNALLRVCCASSCTSDCESSKCLADGACAASTTVQRCTDNTTYCDGVHATCQELLPLAANCTASLSCIDDVCDPNVGVCCDAVCSDAGLPGSECLLPSCDATTGLCGVLNNVTCSFQAVPMEFAPQGIEVGYCDGVHAACQAALVVGVACVETAQCLSGVCGTNTSVCEGTVGDICIAQGPLAACTDTGMCANTIGHVIGTDVEIDELVCADAICAGQIDFFPCFAAGAVPGYCISK
jgi:hypothetical protein